MRTGVDLLHHQPDHCHQASYITSVTLMECRHCHKKIKRKPVRCSHTPESLASTIHNSTDTKRKEQGTAWYEAPHVTVADEFYTTAMRYCVRQGDMVVVVVGRSPVHLVSGQSISVPAQSVFSMRMGPQGCHYTIMEEME
jgi:hypothetical protein